MGSGSNSVLVYHTAYVDPLTGRPVFDSVTSYPVGTDPVSVTIADINGDEIPDMIIADQGSNQISILFGSYKDGQWVGTPGPRLKSGGIGPVSTTLLDLNGLDGISSDGPDLVVTNAQSGTIAVLPGRGQGFFDDRNPTLFDLGSPLLAPPTFVGDSDQGYAVAANGSLLGFNLANFDGTLQTVFSSAVDVVAALALGDGSVVALTQSGQVEELQANETGQLDVVQTLVPLSGIPSDPSALDVLLTDDGMRAFVTSAGQDTVFVYGLGDFTLPSASIEVATVSETSTNNDVALSLIVFLAPGGNSTEGTTSGGEETANTLVAGVFAEAETGPGSGGGDELDLMPPPGDEIGGIDIDIDGALRDLDLRPQRKDKDDDGALLRPPPPPGVTDSVLAFDTTLDLPLYAEWSSPSPTPRTSPDPPALPWTADAAAAQPVPVARHEGIDEAVAVRTAETMAEAPPMERPQGNEPMVSCGDDTLTPLDQPFLETAPLWDSPWEVLLDTLAASGVAWWMGPAQSAQGRTGEGERDDCGVHLQSPGSRRFSKRHSG